MDQVISTDGQAITVTGDDDYMQIRSCQFQTGCKCDRTSMRGVKRVGIDIGTQAARAAYSADNRQLIFLDIEIVYLFPWAINLRELGGLGFVEMFIFAGILGLGLVYAWRKGALEWE